MDMTVAAIDRQVFAALQANVGTDFVVELIDTFAVEAPQLLAELRAALARGAADPFRRAAHALKSNGNAFGATRFAEAARALELGGLDAAAGGIDTLAHEFERALAELRQLSQG
jgi:HPt (histidine-containing phosphotransfer) domain-containing protein